MADRIRFHFDEHVDPGIAVALRRAGIVVTTTTETNLKGANDEAQLEFARSQKRVIVTRDQDFLRLAARSQAHNGIIFFTSSESMREIIEGLILIHEVLLPEELAGNVEYL